VPRYRHQQPLAATAVCRRLGAHRVRTASSPSGYIICRFPGGDRDRSTTARRQTKVDAWRAVAVYSCARHTLHALPAPARGRADHLARRYTAGAHACNARLGAAYAYPTLYGYVRTRVARALPPQPYYRSAVIREQQPFVVWRVPSGLRATVLLFTLLAFIRRA